MRGELYNENRETKESLMEIVSKAIDEQMVAVGDWHNIEPDQLVISEKNDKDKFLTAVLLNHLMNFKLWHIEDICRRVDIDAETVANCKHRIDELNQSRTDAFECVDECLVKLIMPLLPSQMNSRYNSETLGMIIDRLSILALKIFHMNEETKRNGASAEHKNKSKLKLDALVEQRNDLAQALFELITDYLEGHKRPKTQYSFKMYNDPTLNPQLYETKGKDI